MIKIYTILENGQPLMPEVLQGILNQTVRCCLIPITSTCKTIEESRIKNWNQARELCKEDIFIGMDSDVVLIDNNAVEILIEKLKEKNYDIVTLPTRKLKGKHGIFAIWKNKFPKLKVIDGCEICYIIRKLNCKYLNFKQKEVQREI